MQSMEFKEIEMLIGGKLKNSKLSDQAKEAIRIFCFFSFNLSG